MDIKQNNNFKRIFPLEVFSYQIPSDEEVHFNKISNLIVRYLGYAKAMEYVPKSMAKAMAFKNIELSLFENLFKIYFPESQINEKDIDKLTNILNVEFAKSKFSKILKACVTGDLLSCNIFIPQNAVSHLYAVAYCIDKHLKSGKNLNEFNPNNYQQDYKEFYERGNLYSKEI